MARVMLWSWRVFLGPLVLLAVSGCTRQGREHLEVRAHGEQVRIPLSTLADGQVHFYTFRHDGRNVDFLVRADHNGTLRAHLDACYSCYRYRRGYVVEGNDLVCVACRLTFPIAAEDWDFQGACAPIPIGSSLDGGYLRIETRVLERATRYF